MPEIERTTSKSGERRYKRPDRAKSPVDGLMPSALAMLQSLFTPDPKDGPSVTTALGALNKPALIGWASKEERKYVSAVAGHLYAKLFDIVDEPVTPQEFTNLLQEELGKPANRQLLAVAANVGTAVHNRIEWELKGELGRERAAEAPALLSAQSQRAFQRWTEWRTTVKLKPIDMEKRIYSTVFGYGGTLDLLAEITIGTTVYLVVLDWKTGKKVYGESFLQNVAYRMAIREEGIDARMGIIVRLPKYEDDPEFDAVTVPDDPSLEVTFLALLVVYKWYGPNNKAPSRAKPKEPINVVT